MGLGKIITKGIGATSLILVARDAHVYGKIKSDEYRKTCDGKACQYYLNNTLLLDKPSKTKSALQNFIFKAELNENIRGFINSAVGYFKGLLGNLIYDVLPLTLGLGALLTKGNLAKGSAIGLGVLAGYSIIKDGFGIGKW